MIALSINAPSTAGRTALRQPFFLVLQLTDFLTVPGTQKNVERTLDPPVSCEGIL
jgi:hypothetical protein